MSTAAGNYDYVFKIILIGDNGVGKSSFIRRFCEGSFVADMETTIGVDFYISELDLNGKKIKVKIWDTAGSEKYMSISAVYYRKADGVIFLFDVTKTKSFTNIESVWMAAVEAPESGCPEAVKLLVGNKCDLQHDMDLTQLQRYAEFHDMEFLEASAKDNRNVEEAFYRLATDICKVKSQQSVKHGGDLGDAPSMSLSNSARLAEREREPDSCSC
eukprot:Em0023g609a